MDAKPTLVDVMALFLTTIGKNVKFVRALFDYNSVKQHDMTLFDKEDQGGKQVVLAWLPVDSLCLREMKKFGFQRQFLRMKASSISVAVTFYPAGNFCRVLPIKDGHNILILCHLLVEVDETDETGSSPFSVFEYKHVKPLSTVEFNCLAANDSSVANLYDDFPREHINDEQIMNPVGSNGFGLFFSKELKSAFVNISVLFSLKGRFTIF